MAEISATNKRIARGTMFLYLRKILAIVIGLYTSRLLLQRLGVDDFGLFGLVGSLITLFSAMRVVFSSSVQRYINVAKAGSEHSVQKIFSLGIKIHWWIAAAFFAVVQIAGFFLIPTLNLPDGGYYAAWWVYELTLLASIVTILTVPFDAVIIANEKFNAYAVISLIEVFLKLLIVILLVFWSSGRVIWYSAMLLAVAVIVRLINLIYCRRTFGDECKYISVHDRKLLKSMTVFAGWNLLGNIGFSATNSGLNFVLNIFGGVAVNAARTIAYQVMHNVQAFVGDLSTSFSPRSTMHLAQKKYDEYYRLMFLNSKVSFYISSVLGFTVAAFAEPVLRIWLGEVPEFSVRFTQAIFLYAMVRSLHGPIDNFFKATGDLKKYQLTEFCIMVLNLPASWIALELGMPYYGVFVIMALLEVINYVFILRIAYRGFQFRVGEYVAKVVTRVGMQLVIYGAAFVVIELLDPSRLGNWNALWIVIVAMIVAAVVGFGVMFTPTERDKILSMIKLKRNKK